MKKYEESISDNSLWITATPTTPAKTLPFFISETGHFTAHGDYKVQRNFHDSFLLLYTVSGQGCVHTSDTAIQLLPEHCIIIDCHNLHEYYSVSETWEFFWIHFNGSGAAPLFDIIYPDNNLLPVNMDKFSGFKKRMSRIIQYTAKNDLNSCIAASSEIHSLLSDIHLSSLDDEKIHAEKEVSDDIRNVIAFIKDNYADSISLDDMIKNVHISKYHFIRCFRRAMGITPYSYLTNYRINMSKTLLRSTDKSVAAIAELCGFLDTSNFITQFKKHTGQKPSQYRKDFS